MFYKNRNYNENQNEMGILCRIDCKTCGGFYIGETKRTLLERVLEHDRALKNKNLGKSDIPDHCVEKGYIMDNNVKILYKGTDLKLRKILESYVIKNTKEIFFNRYEAANVDPTTIVLMKDLIKTNGNKVATIDVFNY